MKRCVICLVLPMCARVCNTCPHSPGNVDASSYCAGRMDGDGVSLCQSLNFQLGGSCLQRKEQLSEVVVHSCRSFFFSCTWVGCGYLSACHQCTLCVKECRGRCWLVHSHWQARTHMRIHNVGLGSLVFIIRCDLIFFYAMTVPVVLLILALPFRLYVCTLVIPAFSCVLLLCGRLR